MDNLGQNLRKFEDTKRVSKPVNRRINNAMAKREYDKRINCREYQR